jgi:hypothetical protein
MTLLKVMSHESWKKLIAALITFFLTQLYSRHYVVSLPECCANTFCICMPAKHLRQRIGNLLHVLYISYKERISH